MTNEESFPETRIGQRREGKKIARRKKRRRNKSREALVENIGIRTRRERRVRAVFGIFVRISW